jgi:hypothetical protein
MDEEIRDESFGDDFDEDGLPKSKPQKNPLLDDEDVDGESDEVDVPEEDEY